MLDDPSQGDYRTLTSRRRRWLLSSPKAGRKGPGEQAQGRGKFWFAGGYAPLDAIWLTVTGLARAVSPLTMA